ncbi:MAG: hypothetical protein ABW321_10445 [Polyangiales bacterium]
MSLAGHWEIELKTPFGIQRFGMDVTEVQGGWAGTLTNQQGSSALEGLQLKADGLWFRARVKLSFGEHDLAFAGVLRNNKMWGKCKSAFGRHDFMAERLP